MVWEISQSDQEIFAERARVARELAVRFARAPVAFTDSIAIGLDFAQGSFVFRCLLKSFLCGFRFLDYAFVPFGLRAWVSLKANRRYRVFLRFRAAYGFEPFSAVFARLCCCGGVLLRSGACKAAFANALYSREFGFIGLRGLRRPVGEFANGPVSGFRNLRPSNDASEIQVDRRKERPQAPASSQIFAARGAYALRKRLELDGKAGGAALEKIRTVFAKLRRIPGFRVTLNDASAHLRVTRIRSERGHLCGSVGLSVNYGPAARKAQQTDDEEHDEAIWPEHNVEDSGTGEKEKGLLLCEFFSSSSIGPGRSRSSVRRPGERGGRPVPLRRVRLRRRRRESRGSYRFRFRASKSFRASRGSSAARSRC